MECSTALSTTSVLCSSIWLRLLKIAVSFCPSMVSSYFPRWISALMIWGLFLSSTALRRMLSTTAAADCGSDFLSSSRTLTHSFVYRLWFIGCFFCEKTPKAKSIMSSVSDIFFMREMIVCKKWINYPFNK